MKLQYMSDLHLEFDPDFRPVNSGADTLVLAGDICVWEYFRKGDASPYKNDFARFFRHVSENWQNVVYVPGNHEYYRGDTVKSKNAFLEFVEMLGNVHLLDNTTVELDGVLFAGTTLWTNLNNGDPITKMHVEGVMNDYRLVSHTSRKLRATDTMLFHSRAMEFLEETAKLGKDMVVVTHMAPTPLSIHPKYANDYQTNFAYHSDLSEFLLDNPNIKTWFHGHVHDTFDYVMGETRVLTNPRGYNGENSLFDQSKVLEI